MNPRGRESDPAAFARPRGDPNHTQVPMPTFIKFLFRGVVRIPPPEPLPAVACSCVWASSDRPPVRYRFLCPCP